MKIITIIAKTISCKGSQGAEYGHGLREEKRSIIYHKEIESGDDGRRDERIRS